MVLQNPPIIYTHSVYHSTLMQCCLTANKQLHYIALVFQGYITGSSVAVRITMDERTLVFIALRNGNVQRQISWRICCDGLGIFNPQLLPRELQERLLQQATAAQTTITSVHTHYSLTMSCKVKYEEHTNASL